MAHVTHKLKAYTGDYNKPLVFCEDCGYGDDEAAIHEPCNQKFIKMTEEFFNQEVQKIVDKYPARKYGNIIAR